MVYASIDIEQKVKEDCPHLSIDLRNRLTQTLLKFDHLLEPKLGDWKGEEVHIELTDDAVPKRFRPYNVSKINMQVAIDECWRQCNFGCLRPISGDEASTRKWAFPAICLAKQNGSIRIVFDFRYLNKFVLRRNYHTEPIDEILARMSKFEYASVIDFNMGYMSMRLDAESRDLLTVVFPWGMFECLTLPQGVASAGDIFQARISQTFMSMQHHSPTIYIDDVKHTAGADGYEHIEILDEILERVERSGMQISIKRASSCN